MKLHRYVQIMIVLFAILGATGYVAFQDNGPVDRYLQERENAKNNTSVNEIKK